MSDPNKFFLALTKEERHNKKNFRPLKKISEAEKTKLNNESTGDKLELLWALTEEERLSRPMFRPLKQILKSKEENRNNVCRTYETTSKELGLMFSSLFSKFDFPDKAVPELGSLELGSPDQGTSGQAPSEPKGAKEAFLNTIYGNNQTTCPVCTRKFNRYSQHKVRREKNQCCICRQIYSSETELVKHLQKFALNKLCCSCDFFKKSSSSFEADEKFHQHIIGCYNSKKKTPAAN